MSEGGQEKTEEATPKRKQEARKKGTVTKSQELVSASVLLAVSFTAPGIIAQFSGSFQKALAYTLNAQQSGVSVEQTFGAILMMFVPMLATLISVIMVAGVSANVAQVGFAFSPEALNPSFAKLNPLSGVKRLFSSSSLFEGGKSMAKAGLFGLIFYLGVRQEWNTILNLGTLPPMAALAMTGKVLHSIIMRLVGAWVALAVLDYIFQRQRTNKQLKMTKEEVRQEMKNQEMSPEVRGARARQRRKIMRMRARDAVRNADVIVTNPTHYAVAIKYELGKDHAPMVLAKGLDHMAAKIREYAAEFNVPLVPNPPLARALYKQCEPGDYVPRELFQGVAETLAFVYKTLKKVRN